LIKFLKLSLNNIWILFKGQIDIFRVSYKYKVKPIILVEKKKLCQIVFTEKLLKHKISTSILGLANSSLLNKDLADFSLVVHVDYRWRSDN
jgi:hypothetical protein